MPDSSAGTVGDGSINVEVVYATAYSQHRVALRLQQASTVKQAIDESGLLAKFAEIDLTRNKVGIYAKLCRLDTTLRDQDRVEIYRPLVVDPKEVRRQRAADGRALKKGARE